MIRSYVGIILAIWTVSSFFGTVNARKEMQTTSEYFNEIEKNLSQTHGKKLTKSEVRQLEDKNQKNYLLATLRYDSPEEYDSYDGNRYNRISGDIFGGPWLERRPGPMTSTEVISALAQSSEILQKRWLEVQNFEDIKQSGDFDQMTFLAIEVANLYMQKEDAAVEKFFNQFETLLPKADTGGHLILTNSFFFSFQNYLGNNEYNPEELRRLLGKNSQEVWDETNRFWKDLEKNYKI